MWERLFLYVTTNKCPRKAIMPLSTSVSYLWTWWAETDTEMLQWPFNNERDAKGITVEPVNQYGSYLHMDVTWLSSQALKIGCDPFLPSLDSHVASCIQRWDGVYNLFSLSFKGLVLYLTFTNRIWWKWHNTSSRTSLKEGLPLSEMSYQVRSLHTQRLSCSEEAQASHVRPHGERGPKPSTSYPSTPAGAPDMWVIKLSWTF